MVTKMRKSMIIVALAVIFCLIAAALSIGVVRNAYADETIDISTENPTLVGGTGDNNNEYVFQPTGVSPEVSVGSLTLNTDYTLTYANNLFATNSATVTVKGIGKYSGEKVLTYVIKPDAALKYVVTWQYYSDGEWKAIDNTNAGKLFTYGDDHSGQVRASLTIDGSAFYREYVYAQGITPDDETNWNPNLYLVYSGTFADNPVDALLDATEYTVTIEGTANVTLDNAVKSTKITIGKAELDIDADDFADFVDGKGNDLWMLYFDVDDVKYIVDTDKASALLDGAGLTYVVDSKAVQGSDGETGVYARYNGTALKLLLNGNYTIGDVALSKLIKGVEIVYEDNSATGEANKKTAVTTKATLTFNENFTMASGKKTIELTKSWNVVSINNGLRYADGEIVYNGDLGEWTYGDSVRISALRPEHGDTIFVSVAKKGGDVVEQFAVKYTTKATYYKVKTVDGKLEADTDNELDDENYYANCILSMATGEYEMTVTVPEFATKPTDSHKHWWEDGDFTDYGEAYYETAYDFKFAVKQLQFVTDNELIDGLTVTVKGNVAYSGKANNTPEITFKSASGKTFTEGVDYELVSSNVNVGDATLTVKGIGSLSGEYTVENAYKIVKAKNDWKEIPSVMYWTYGAYNRQVNLIGAVPLLLDNPEALWFKVTTDANGEKIALTSLARFGLVDDGYISNVAAEQIATLPVGTYYLFAYVDGNGNYDDLSYNGVPFQVFTANNYWEETPGITTWIVGSFTAENLPTAKAHHGEVNIVIRDFNDESVVIYDLANGINKLNEAPVGKYVMKASVANDPDGNFLGIEKTIYFDIFEKAGLPWWAIVVLVVGFLGVAALIVFILLKAGVFKILTRKLTLEIRTKATIEATIAAVRANKVAEAAKVSVAKAKARDRAKQLNEARKAEMAKPAEERAEALALKARQHEERAERMRAKAEAMHARAASLKAAADDKEAAATSTDKSTED